MSINSPLKSPDPIKLRKSTRLLSGSAGSVAAMKSSTESKVVVPVVKPNPKKKWRKILNELKNLKLS